jgi:predicted regulator of Ras-like GTPase activity (Roadblock/LC7/MglB family)
MAPTSVREVQWLLDSLVEQVSDIKQAVILTRDGLMAAASQGISREDGDHLSALAAGLQSLARGAGERFNGGDVRQSVIEMEHVFLFVMAAGRGSLLAVLTAADVDVGLVAYEAAMLVKRVGPHLETPPRFPAEDLATEHEASGGT